MHSLDASIVWMDSFGVGAASTNSRYAWVRECVCDDYYPIYECKWSLRRRRRLSAAAAAAVAGAQHRAHNGDSFARPTAAAAAVLVCILHMN